MYGIITFAILDLFVYKITRKAKEFFTAGCSTSVVDVCVESAWETDTKLQK
jgi:hypothetical protein